MSLGERLQTFRTSVVPLSSSVKRSRLFLDDAFFLKRIFEFPYSINFGVMLYLEEGGGSVC